MSEAESTLPAAVEARSGDFGLRSRQARAIMRLELKRTLLGKRAILVYLLAFLPVVIMGALAIFGTQETTTSVIMDGEGNIVSRETVVRPGPLADPATATVVFAGVHEGLIVRTVIFFGCAWIFMNLFRGDIVDKSLHYYFLSPVRREVLVLGKYCSGLVTSLLLFGFSTIGGLFFLFYPRGVNASSQYIFNGPGARQIVWYLVITALACVGYGAAFLLIGLIFRNPIVPALLIYGWEWINFLLPPFLKKISIIHYLSSLAPVPISQGSFAIITEPTAAKLAIPGLILVSGVFLFLASRRARRMEINYGTD